MKSYRDTEQISKRDKEYKFKLPKYGKSTTDPTYYEPTATRIANMKKAASSSVALYDFNDSSKVPDITEIHVAPGRKPYMTKEEISQETTNIRSQLENEVNKNKADKESLDKQIKDIKNIRDSLNNDTDSTVNAEE